MLQARGGDGPVQTAEGTVRAGVLAWTGSMANPVRNDGGWLIYQLPAVGAPHGVAESREVLWATDPSRQKLARVSLIPRWEVYLPLAARAVRP